MVDNTSPDQDETNETTTTCSNLLQGASLGEQLIEAARRNNTQLLNDIIKAVSDPERLTALLNNTKTVLGNYIYHEAALQGNYEIIDILLDQEGFECDPINRIEGDTPLHSAIRYINSLSALKKAEVKPFAKDLITMMIEAGSDPRIKNKAKLTPYQLADPGDQELRRIIQDAIDADQNRGDFINQDDAMYSDENPERGSGSDSDFDQEEYKRQKERQKPSKNDK
ncbi:ankyrin repeat protein [Blumeria hordei DH14]|uniref:Ankyrin repeat protein n=1 Tax=Blumeria graminis f. sp. hordei (strain DH14) TaxID=546991 RepID=N1J6F8_BLUG1|nr:ankyrin repeat protein [Blumeria hordei DH14]